MQSHRLAKLEQAVGAVLPSEYKLFLATHVSQDQPNLAFSGERHWDVRTLYELADGGLDDQLDRVYSLVGDVLPAYALPIGEDWGGNFYCLITHGDSAGHVVWWNHERELGDDRTEPVAPSFAAFSGGLVHHDEA